MSKPEAINFVGPFCQSSTQEATIRDLHLASLRKGHSGCDKIYCDKCASFVHVLKKKNVTGIRAGMSHEQQKASQLLDAREIWLAGLVALACPDRISWHSFRKRLVSLNSFQSFKH